MDISELKEMVEPDILADYLGLEYQEKGGRFLILCPFHGDRNLGSAYIRNGWFHCFSCGESMDIVELVQKVENIGFYKAVKILANLAGVSIDFNNNEDNGYLKYRLTQDELNILDFPKSTIPLKNIYLSAPKIYKEIVLKRTKEKKEHYQNLITSYADRTAENAYRVYELYKGNVNPQTFRDIKDEANKRIRVCNMILERFS